MTFTFSIDKVLNKYIPPNQIHHLPHPLRRVLGGHSPNPPPDYLVWLEILIASFCGIALLDGLFKSHTVFSHHHVNSIIASYAATAILCFNASSVPLAQPKNIFFGHFLSSLLGICIQKLFSLSEAATKNYWASAALSVGVSSVVMSICNCIHPPAGASAMLPSIDANVREMSWWYLPVQVISSVLIIAVACITGNILRKYPTFWWSPANCGTAYKSFRPPKSESESESTAPTTAPINAPNNQEKSPYDMLRRIDGLHTIEILPNEIRVPAHMDFDETAIEYMQSLSQELHPQP